MLDDERQGRPVGAVFMTVLSRWSWRVGSVSRAGLAVQQVGEACGVLGSGLGVVEHEALAGGAGDVEAFEV